MNTDEADRLNLLGFTARKSGDLAAAGDYYQQALALNPKHTGALEYQGELFIQLGKIELAKANLAKIDKICWLPCNAERDLKKAIDEMYRVLKPHGKLVMSDPTCEQPMNDELRNDDRLRALCLSGSLSIADYVKALTDAGFGTIEIRARKPYRILDPKHYPTEELIYIESIEVAAIKDPMPADGPCVFTGKAAIYYGADHYFDDKSGHVLVKNQPLAICDKTAGTLKNLNRNDIFISESTFHYDGGGCC